MGQEGNEFLTYLFVGVTVGLLGTLLSLVCGSNKLVVAYGIGAGISIVMTPLWKRLFSEGHVKDSSRAQHKGNKKLTREH